MTKFFIACDLHNKFQFKSIPTDSYNDTYAFVFVHLLFFYSFLSTVSWRIHTRTTVLITCFEDSTQTTTKREWISYKERVCLCGVIESKSRLLFYLFWCGNLISFLRSATTKQLFTRCRIQCEGRIRHFRVQNRRKINKESLHL